MTHKSTAANRICRELTLLSPDGTTHAYAMLDVRPVTEERYRILQDELAGMLTEDLLPNVDCLPFVPNKTGKVTACEERSFQTPDGWINIRVKVLCFRAIEFLALFEQLSQVLADLDGLVFLLLEDAEPADDQFLGPVTETAAELGRNVRQLCTPEYQDAHVLFSLPPGSIIESVLPEPGPPLVVESVISEQGRAFAQV